MRNEIIIYHLDELSTRIEVRIEEDTLWLTQAQIMSLFETSKANVSEHINHIFSSKELDERATVRIFRTVRKEGNRTVARLITHYNLDMIISIGYRVNSFRGTQFRIWANRILRAHLLKGYTDGHRIIGIERDIKYLKEKVEQFDIQVKTILTPKEGIFFNGQVFDAYIFVSELIRSARKSIVLIDSHVDETTFLILSKRGKDVEAAIYTNHPTTQLKLDHKKHNQQYPTIGLQTFSKAHDRFLILDNHIVYHIGASLKDLGKKWFAFSRLEFDAKELIERLYKD